MTALLGEEFVRREPGSRVIYDVRASRAVADRVEAAGGAALVNRVGHAFIKKRMRDEGAVFGGEVSGHFYFRDNWFADNGMIPALLMLETPRARGAAAQRDPGPPARAVPHLRGDQLPGRGRRAGPRPPRGALRRRPPGTLDGLSVDYEDWHFNVRPSNTEPLLRLNLEAGSQAEMERRRDEVLALVRG